jgi:hypothetical protein
MSKPSTKEIKRLILKNIKKNYPKFSKHTKNEKKELLTAIYNQVINNSNVNSIEDVAEHELLNLKPLPENIISIEQMKELMTQKQTNIFSLTDKWNRNRIEDTELKDIFSMIDWEIINSLVAPTDYAPGKRAIQPVQFFRAELLKHLKCPELSYRKYTKEQINNAERIEYRAFIGLKKEQQISHSQLSQFRNSLSFRQLTNVMVYFICLFLEKKTLSKSTFYAMDSTEVASKTSPYPLFKMKLGDQTVRVYQDIDADVGTRRQKRDKSIFVVGYRLHTLTIIDAKSQIAFPLLSLLAPANHHDSNFLELMIDFGKRIGLQINVVTTDQAYGDADELKSIHKKHNVTVLNAPKELTKLPENVDKETYAVKKDAFCPTEMEYAGCDETRGHEFHCHAQPGECPFEGACSKIRLIPVDTGIFGKLPYFLTGASKIVGMRKVAERPFNLIKHRDGLEPLRTKGIGNSTTVATIANITTLLIEIAGYRKKITKSCSSHKTPEMDFMKEAA